jgi:hypothetical protein
VRRLVIALVAVFCLGLIVVYSGHVLVGEQRQSELNAMQTRVAVEQQRQQTLQALIAGADDPAAVEAFAREANQARPGEVVIVPFLVTPTPAPKGEGLPSPSTSSRPNWRLWWDLLATPARP